MKTCKNCHFYTGIQCHGHGDYWGECNKNKNTLYCFDDTPCLQDIKTLRQLYYDNSSKINSLERQNEELKAYKERYEVKCRHLDKLRDRLFLALTYIPKEKAQEFNNKAIERWYNNEKEK